MKHASQSQFGRQISLCQPPTDPTSATSRDKWALLEQLTTAASAFGLSHRSLGVLRALLTFLPQRIIPGTPREAVVFPSNKTLSKRLNGMPESTLRRHLAQLVSAGIVSRHDSANRKRFARRTTGLAQVAFGFDLSPFARQAGDIAKAAAAVEDVLEEEAALRAELAHLRQTVLAQSGPSDVTDESFKALRRKPDAARLQDLCTALRQQITPQRTEEMIGTDGQNERHIQQESRYISEDQSTTEQGRSRKKTIRLDHIVAQCSEYQSYFPTPVRHWEDIINIANRLVPMMGIERPVFDEAIKVIGIHQAATLILCMLEKLGTITNPGGYLRRISQRAGAGGVDWNLMQPRAT